MSNPWSYSSKFMSSQSLTSPRVLASALMVTSSYSLVCRPCSSTAYSHSIPLASTIKPSHNCCSSPALPCVTTQSRAHVWLQSIQTPLTQLQLQSTSPRAVLSLSLFPRILHTLPLSVTLCSSWHLVLLSVLWALSQSLKFIHLISVFRIFIFLQYIFFSHYSFSGVFLYLANCLF